MRALRLLAVLLAVLLLAEIGLRAAGRGPWRPFDSFDSLPTISLADDRLGWRNQPGLHHYDAPWGPVQVTIGTAGTRGTPRPDGRPVVLLGGSYLYGFGLSDDQVISAQLEALRPDVRAVNHAVPGYSTLQSLLLAEQLDLTGATVVYGFVELHEGRNAAARSWLHALDRASSRQAWVRLPWAWWDGDALRVEPPRSYRHWSWSESLALIDATERAWIGLQDRTLRTKAETTAQLMAQLRNVVRARGGELQVALLDVPTRRAFYERRLTELAVPWIRLELLGTLPDGHPDPATHAHWARQLGAML